MKLSAVSVVVLSTAVAADILSYPWIAPSATDRRCPCPMLNSLANHGILSRSGEDISMDQLISVFNNILNLGEDATRAVGAVALTASTTGNASTFHLDDLNTHGIIEHDSSLSRADTALGDNHSFNEAIWNQTKSYFTTPTISIAQAAKARSERLKQNAIENPAMNMTAAHVQGSFLEVALYLTVFGDLVEGEAVRDYVTTLFEEERLPYAEGWTRPNVGSNITTIRAMAGKLVAATS